MASLQQLQNDVAGWLNRQDFIAAGLFPSWVSMLETELSETLRARCQEVSATQAIDAPYISLPADFATMASMRDAVSGANLELKDEWSPKGGGWQAPYAVYSGTYPSLYWQINPASPCYAYRIVADCLEFLPHPNIPDPPDPTWVPQQVLMAYYQKPRPLVLPTDTNPILENLYSVYLFGLCKLGAIWALDDARAQQMDSQWQQVVTRANLWKQQADLSGAPLRSEMAVVF
jgi:hypothetical protein